MHLTYRKLSLPAGGPATIDQESRSVEVVAATENPTQVYDWERGLIDEVLLMDGLELPANGQMPLLDSHSRYSSASLVGSVRGLSRSRGQLIGRAYFTRSPEVDPVWTRVAEGHLTDFSVGYRVMESTWIPAGQSQKIGNRTYQGPVAVTTRWRAKELSIVPIGADEHAKARTERSHINMEFQNIEDQEANKRPRTLRREAARQVREEISEIMALGDAHGYTREASEAVQEGWSSDKFRNWILDKMAERGNKPVETSNFGELGLNRSEIQQFSFLRAIRALSSPENRRLQEEAGFEFECSRAVEDMTRRNAKGLFVPVDVLRHDMQRDMATSSLSTGGAFVSEKLATASFIDTLENVMVVKALGAIMLRDLVGNLAIPKKTGGATAYWVGEGEDVTESTPATGQVALRPKTVGDFTDLTRKFILQSSIDAEMFVRAELAMRLALAIDLAALAGTGANEQPLGILNTTGIGAVTLNAANTPDWGDICDLWGAVAVDNALVGNLAYTCNATIAKNMMQTPKHATATAGFILEDNKLNGYPFLMSNQVTAAHILFGNWRDLVIGEWSGVDINVDTATLSKSGGVRVVALQDVDVAVRHPESFADGTA